MGVCCEDKATWESRTVSCAPRYDFALILEEIRRSLVNTAREAACSSRVAVSAARDSSSSRACSAELPLAAVCDLFDDHAQCTVCSPSLAFELTPVALEVELPLEVL